MIWIQRQMQLKARVRGFHLITEEIERALPELAQIEMGLLHVFIQHTSASLTINENADPTVRVDFESWFNRHVRENESYYRHTLEGSDDMPAHLKASLLGNGVTVPIAQGLLALGTWQGVYLGEHRDYGGSRRLLLTLQGQPFDRS